MSDTELKAARALKADILTDECPDDGWVLSSKYLALLDEYEQALAREKALREAIQAITSRMYDRHDAIIDDFADELFALVEPPEEL